MSGNADNILAGIEAGGTAGNSLAWFAVTGSTAPTTATAAPAAAFKDAGWCSQDGLTAAASEASTDIPAYGTFAPVRTITTSSKRTFAVTFLESNPISLAVYHRKSLTAISPDTSGAFDFTEGEASTQRYSAVFDMVDGANHIRAYCPSVGVTDRGDLVIRGGQVVSYPVTLTAFPGSDGVAVHWFYVVNALATP